MLLATRDILGADFMCIALVMGLGEDHLLPPLAPGREGKVPEKGCDEGRKRSSAFSPHRRLSNFVFPNGPTTVAGQPKPLA